MPLKRLEPCVRQPDRRRRAGLRQLVRERDPVVEALPGPETVTLVVKCPARPQKRQREKIYCGKLRPLKRPGHLNSGRLNALGRPPCHTAACPGGHHCHRRRQGGRRGWLSGSPTAAPDSSVRAGNHRFHPLSALRQTQKRHTQPIYCGKR